MRLRTLTGLTITAIALAAPAGAQAGTCPGAGVIPTSATVAAAVDATLCLANQERVAAGVPPLTLDSRLSDMAADYGRRMVAEQFSSHVAPDGSSLAERLAAIG